MQKKLFLTGIVFLNIGGILDRIIYLYYYLPKSKYAGELIVGLKGIFSFYKWPVSWIGLCLIVVGVVLLLFPASEHDDGDLEE